MRALLSLLAEVTTTGFSLPLPFELGIIGILLTALGIVGRWMMALVKSKDAEIADQRRELREAYSAVLPVVQTANTNQAEMVEVAKRLLAQLAIEQAIRAERR